jgi:hypothetical protein
MREPLSLGDFRKSNQLLSDEDSKYEDVLAPFTWKVYKTYVGEVTETDFVIRAKGTRPGSPELRKAYQPLVDEPGLFLSFARIPEKSIRKKRHWFIELFEWIRDYGLLGLVPDMSKSEGLFEDESRYTPEVTLVPFEYKSEGGPGELGKGVIREMWMAHYALTLYEAALREDVDKIRDLLLFEGDRPEGRQRELQQVRRLWDQKSKDLASFEEALLEHALMRVLEVTDFKLSLYTYPVYRPTVNRSEELTAKLISRAGITYSWGARNLLGAMYLQFYWLITSGASLCESCGHLMPQKPSADSEGKRSRKTPSHKKFCGDRCRSNYHYHNRIKPKRMQEFS